MLFFDGDNYTPPREGEKVAAKPSDEGAGLKRRAAPTREPHPARRPLIRPREIGLARFLLLEANRSRLRFGPSSPPHGGEGKPITTNSIPLLPREGEQRARKTEHPNLTTPSLCRTLLTLRGPKVGYRVDAGDIGSLLKWHNGDLPDHGSAPPRFMCLYLSGSDASRDLLNDYLADWESMDLLLGSDIGFFFFGDEFVRFAVKIRSANAHALSEQFAEVKQLVSSHVVPLAALGEATVRAHRGELVGSTILATTEIAAQFDIEYFDRPCFILLEKHNHHSPWIMRPRGEETLGEFKSLVRDLRAISEDLKRAQSSADYRFQSTVAAIAKLERDIENNRTASEANQVALTEAALVLHRAKQALVEMLADAAVPSGAASDILAAAETGEIWSWLGSARRKNPSPKLADHAEVIGELTSEARVKRFQAVSQAIKVSKKVETSRNTLNAEATALQQTAKALHQALSDLAEAEARLQTASMDAIAAIDEVSERYEARWDRSARLRPWKEFGRKFVTGARAARDLADLTEKVLKVIE